MTYNNLIQNLFDINLISGMKLGLNNCIALQKLLDYPERKFPSVHVAGTNGKGSVVTKIATGLQAAGYRVGLYTSPHISCFRERIKINGKMIPKDTVEKLLAYLFELINKEKIPATFFEITTFMAFLYFAQENVDVAVLETGLGGRLDATNIVTPLLSIITSISLDHTELLGTTLEEIAREKGGIIKPNIPVILGPHVPLKPIRAIAEELNSPYFQIKETSPSFEEENRLIAQTSLERLSEHFSISQSHIKQGLEGKQPCRFEIHDQIVLDVAHNPDGLIHLFEAVKQRFGLIPIRLLFGLSKNKDLISCLKIISENAEDFFVVEAPNGRGAPITTLESGLLELNISKKAIHPHKNISDAMDEAMKKSLQDKKILVVCGSFFIMDQVRLKLGIDEERDSFDMNER